MVHSNDHDRVTSSITSTNEVLYDLSYEASQTPSLLANKPFTICTPNTSGLGNSFNPFEPQIEDIFFHSNPFPLVYDGSEFIDFAAPTQLLALPQSPYRFDTAGSNLGHPPKRTKLVPIAPHPVGLQKLHALKRSRSEVSDSHDPAELQLSKRRKRSPSLTPPSNFNLSKEDNLLIQLREYENLPWKDIALRFEVEVGKVYKVATLQMRYHRLRLRIKMWTDTDVRTPTISEHLTSFTTAHY
ncbi:MAG: hypothetical protein M1827_003780 [Pycnora praestabilis]|nr:MAG: hypothetical protein M1827_003780 [Pycnora praestabilis]